jgi:hypothetical protein
VDSTSSTVPRGIGDTTKNWEIGEFKNEGRLNDVVDSIIFNLRFLYSLFDIPFDTNKMNVSKSAESKEKDDQHLVNYINMQRSIWTLNEKQLFKVLQAVYNRENGDVIPEGVELFVNFEEKKTGDASAEDWLTKIDNNIASIFDWLANENVGLDRDELINLYNLNKSDNKQRYDGMDTEMSKKKDFMQQFSQEIEDEGSDEPDEEGEEPDEQKDEQPKGSQKSG